MGHPERRGLPVATVAARVVMVVMVVVVVVAVAVPVVLRHSAKVAGLVHGRDGPRRGATHANHLLLLLLRCLLLLLLLLGVALVVLRRGKALWGRTPWRLLPLAPGLPGVRRHHHLL